MVNEWSRLNSAGIPLPLVGMLAYGLVAALSLQENSEELLPGLDDLDIRLTLLLLATSLATASAYFLFILNTKFVGTSCVYCLSSAFISFTLFFIRIKVCAFLNTSTWSCSSFTPFGDQVTHPTNLYQRYSCRTLAWHASRSLLVFS
jgi:uncharacterized membrane protein